MGRSSGKCYNNLTPDPWYNLAASIVIDAILAADYRFFSTKFGASLMSNMGCKFDAEAIIDEARREGRLYVQ